VLAYARTFARFAKDGDLVVTWNWNEVARWLGLRVVDFSVIGPLVRELEDNGALLAKSIPGTGHTVTVVRD
jgi:hypothetical protein